MTGDWYSPKSDPWAMGGEIAHEFPEKHPPAARRGGPFHGDGTDTR